MTVSPVPIQTQAADPAHYFDKPPAEAHPHQDDAWLI
jgi:hypothetical protein